jgi:hypothetical protein
MMMSLCITSAFASGPYQPKRPYQTVSLGTSSTSTMTVEWDLKITGIGSFADPQVEIIMGLTGSANKPDAPSKIPIIVRFRGNTTSPWLVDVRNGADYNKMADVQFEKDKTYHIKVTEYFDSKTYDVWVNGTQVAQGFAFRIDAEPITDVGSFVFCGQEEPNGNTSIISNLKVPVPTVLQVTAKKGSKYTIDQKKLTIKLPLSKTVTKIKTTSFKADIKASKGATYKLYNSNGKTAFTGTYVTKGLKLKLTGSDKKTITYTLI